MAQFKDERDFYSDGYGDAAANPAAPKGLKQTANRLDAAQARYVQNQGGLTPWMPQTGLLETAKSWYTGANSEGTRNGWDTTFYDNTFSQINQYEQKRDQAQSPSVFFDWLDVTKNPEATGVATWENPEKDIKFGDVFNNGKKVANLYDDYDEATADVMIGEFMFDANTKARMFDSGTPRETYRSAVDAKRQEFSDQARYAPQAEQFQREVDERQKALHEGGWADVGAIAAGAAGGAATFAGTGALVGSIVPGIGTAIGAGTFGLVGSVVGGVGGWLNRDQLSEMTARGMEITERANAQYGQAAALGVGISEAAGLGSKLIAPGSNWVQGIRDATGGNQGGDLKVGFYDNGGAGAPWQGADIAAAAFDSVLQFSSFVGRMAYMGTMTGHIVGGTGSMTTVQGGWSDSKAEFDKYEGWQEWSAAIGSTGIDVAQLGMAGAMAKVSASTRAAFGGAPLKSRDVTVAGLKYTLDDAGRAVGKPRMTLEMLAPSEFLKYVPIGMRARTMKAASKGALTADDMYRAALETTRSGSRFRDSLLLAYAEGGEEFIQAGLDPLSMSEAMNFRDMTTAYLYGAAAGLGMGYGSFSEKGQRYVGNAEQSKAMGRTLYALRTGTDPTEEEFDAIWERATPGERQRMTIGNSEEAAQLNGMLKIYGDMHRVDLTHQSAIGLAKAEDMKNSRWAKQYKKALEEGGGSLVLMGQSGDQVVTEFGEIDSMVYAPNSAVMTAFEVVNQLRNINLGMMAQADSLATTQAKLRDQLAALEAADPLGDQLTQKLKDIDEALLDLAGQKQISDNIVGLFLGMHETLANTTDADTAQSVIDEMNMLLARAFNGQWVDNNGARVDDKTTGLVQRAVEFKLSRHPLMDQGSLAILMPQVSTELTKLGAHSTVYMHQATLKVLQADHDGDTGVPMHDVYLPPAQLQAARQGDQYISERTDENGNWAGVEVTADAPDGEAAYLDRFAEAMREPGSFESTLVLDGLEKLIADFTLRYSSVLPAKELTKHLNTFREATINGVLSARFDLVNALFNVSPTSHQAMMTMDQDSIPEPLWMLDRINREWDSIQKQLAHVYAINPKVMPLGDPGKLPDESAFLVGKARDSAVNAGQTTSMIGQSADPVRQSQYLHYTALYRSSTDVTWLEGNQITDQEQQKLTEAYANLTGGMSQSEMRSLEGKNAIEDRVVFWLQKMAQSVENPGADPNTTLLLLANTKVPDLRKDGTNSYVIGGNDITLLQLLLRRSLEIEENVQRKAPPDADITLKINKLRRLTFAEGKSSYTAAKAVMEIFGNWKAYDLLGEDSFFLGPQMTLNQLSKQLNGQHERYRNQTLYKLRHAPAYFRHPKMKDPPWYSDVLYSGQINGYTMAIDTLATAVQTNTSELEDRNAATHTAFITGFNGLQARMDTWRKENAVRLRTSGSSDIEVLRDLLAYRPEIAELIADLIPEAAELGVFKVHEGKVYTTKWVEEMLTTRDAEKAAVLYFVNTKFAELNQMGGTLKRNAETGELEGEATPGKVTYDEINSRFLQTVYTLMDQPDGIEIARLLREAHNAPNLETLFKTINNETAWRNKRAKLLPYFDDVALFEVTPRDVWNANLPGTLQREKIANFGSRMSMMSQVAVTRETTRVANNQLMAAMDASMRGTIGATDMGTMYAGLLQMTIDNRKKFPDSIGQAAREQLIELLQDSLVRMHDKGKADDAARGVGEALPLVDGFGYTDSLRQEINAIASIDFEDIRTNLTKLVDGPVRIMLPDGSYVRIDMSDQRQAMNMLMDPRTHEFAVAVLGPTSRDVNNNNVVQAYQDTDSEGSLAEMLKEATYAHLFTGRTNVPEKLRQAYRYIGTVEAGVRKATLGTNAAQAEGFFPIQNMINDFVTAYTHSATAKDKNPQAVRDRLVIDVADALKAVSSVEEGLLDKLREAITATMRDRYLEDESALDDFLMSDAEKQYINGELRSSITEAFEAKLRDLDRQLDAVEEWDEDKRNALQDEKIELAKTVQKLVDGPSDLALPPITFRDMNSVLNMYTMTGERDVDLARKTRIRDALGKMNRMNKFRSRDTYDLILKTRRLMAADWAAVLDSKEISEEEWNQLGEWTATVFFSEMTARSGSSVPETALLLGPDGEQVRKYFDVTWSYLVDPLFDKNVLTAARQLAAQADMKLRTTREAAAKVLDNGLLHEDKLGEWTDRIPMESMKARQILRQSPISTALQIPGNLPKEMADYIGSSWPSFQLPSPEHMSTATLNGKDGMGIPDMLNGDPMAYVKLQNHFVSKLTITANNPLEHIPPDAMDLMQTTAIQNFSHADVENSPYRVLDLRYLDDMLTQYRAKYAITDYTIEIEYVDVDKKPGDDAEFANSIFFQGVGRGSLTGAAPGAIAALYFGLNGLSKVGQQNPLDMATKKGKGFKQFVASTLDVALNMEVRGAPLSEVLGKKAMHLLEQEYEHGELLLSDLPALYQLMKMRHVVVGTNANGEKEVWWPDKLIELETQKADIPLDNIEIIALSESVAQTLRGGGGFMGVPGVMTRPVLNVQDLLPLPSLDPARLKELGITRLGEQTEPWDSSLAQVSIPQQAMVTKDRGKSLRTRYQQRIEKWRGEMQTVAKQRMSSDKKGERQFDIGRINEQNIRRLNSLLDYGTRESLFRRLGIPYGSIVDLAALEVSARLAAQVERLMEDTNNVVWQHVQDQGQDLPNGILGLADVKNNFADFGHATPMMGDVVIVDLGSIMRATGQQYEEAEQQAREVIETYSSRGVTIALASDTGDFLLHNAVTEWLKEGSLGYRALAKSRDFFAPINQDPNYNVTRNALESTQTATQIISAQGVGLALVSDTVNAALSENTTYIDEMHDTTFHRISHTIVPTAIDGTGSAGVGEEQYSFNTPADGRGAGDQYGKMVAKLRPFLLSTEGREHLRKLAGGDGDPAGVNKLRKVNGKPEDPGVLSFDKAIDELLEMLEAGNYPLDPGTTLRTGSIVPVVSGSGQILLTRVGYKLPDMQEMSKQFAAPIGRTEREPGEVGLKVAISKSELDKAQTVPPPFVVESVHSDRRGFAVKGHYTQGAMAKMIWEGVGYKAGLAPLPRGLKFSDTPMAETNGMRVTQITSKKSVEGKGATRGSVDNFRWGFALSGIDFRADLLDVLLGKENRDEAKFASDWDSLQTLLEDWSRQDTGYSATDMQRALDVDVAAMALENELNGLGASMIEGWQNITLQTDPNVTEDPQRRLVLTILATLQAPGVRLEHVVGTQGLLTVSDRNSPSQVVLMPEMLTDALDDMSFPDLRNMLLGRINGRMPKDPTTKEPLYFFDNTWQFHTTMTQEHKDGGTLPVDARGTLQVVLPLPADENSVSLTQAALTSNPRPSAHVSRTVNMAMGGLMIPAVDKNGNPVPTALDELYGDNQILRFEDGTDGSVFWDMLSRTMGNDTSYSRWERAMPMQELHLEKADMLVRQYTTAVDKADWDDEALVIARIDEVLAYLNLSGENNRVELDYLVRQFLGRPGAAANQADFVEELNQSTYLQALAMIRENIGMDGSGQSAPKGGVHPLHGGAVPMEHSVFWEKLYLAQEGAREPWVPLARKQVGRKEVSIPAEGWYGWVNTLIGQTMDSNEEFHTMFRTSLDGFWHTYQGRTPNLQVQAFSTDELKNLRLMDPNTNRLWLSVDPGLSAVLNDPIIIDSMTKNYDRLVGHEATFSAEAARTAPASDLTAQIARQKKWLQGQKMATQNTLSVKEYAKQGAYYTEQSRSTNGFFRGMTNLSITMRLLNPALYVSAFIEVPFRNALEQTTNLLNGTGTSPAGQGMSPKLQAREVAKLNDLARQLGESNQFQGEIMGEMMYTGFVEPGKGKISSALERSATTVAMLTSDPRWGLAGTSVAKRYLEAALEYLVMTNSAITVDQLVYEMKNDPLWLKKNSAPGQVNAHTVGMNRVAQVRATKQTMGGKAVMTPIDRMTSSGSVIMNGAGHLLKIPFMFTRFNLNTLMTLSGLGGLDQMAAMFMDQRERPAALNRMSEFAGFSTAAENEGRVMDMSDVIEGIDLGRAFVKSGVSHTGLMAMGMLAGNLGIGGEDEEERRRRRMATYLNTPYLYDMREAQNDFRWKDAIFLDQIPVFGSLFQSETGRSAVVPHWILDQFLSPVLGMVRFFENGDIREIGYGFGEAASAMPRSVLNLWDRASVTADLLQEAALPENQVDSDKSVEAQSDVTQLFVNVVGMYEKALIESQFVNALRSAGDEFDRNPYIVPRTADENTGELDRLQGTNEPQQTNALVDYRDDNGEVRSAYLTRTGMDAIMHQYAENNATAALLLSVFTGQPTNSSYARKNMVVKTQNVQVDETSREEAEAYILSAFAGANQGGAQPDMTKDEFRRVLKARDEANGVWWDQAAIEAQADQMFDASSNQGWRMSILDDSGREMIDKDGATGVFKSLWNGAITLDDQALTGVNMSQALRDEIAEDWLTEIVQEGMDLGLGEEAAGYRAKRFWLGNFDDPNSVGLRELLYDRRIPSKQVAEYDQLNVTYVIGPDGKPWATPFDRQSWSQAVGLPLPHRITPGIPGRTTLDERGNVVDLVRGINTGLAGIVPTAIEPAAIVETDDPLDKALAKDYETGGGSYSRRPWTNYGGGYSSGGGGGYSSSGGSSYFTRMTPLPRGVSPRGNTIQMINTNTPYVRRARVHRERFSSKRGRLKQWQ